MLLSVYRICSEFWELAQCRGSIMCMVLHCVHNWILVRLIIWRGRARDGLFRRAKRSLRIIIIIISIHFIQSSKFGLLFVSLFWIATSSSAEETIYFWLQTNWESVIVTRKWLPTFDDNICYMPRENWMNHVS